MTIPFTTFFERLQKAAGIATQMELADALGLNRSAVTQAKTRDAVPQKWILSLSRRYGLSPDWLEFGTGAPRPAPARRGQAEASPASTRNHAVGRPLADPAPSTVEELIYVPKVSARLCAGGGSFEVEGLPVAEYPFPRAWLGKLGLPSAMLFMDVVGDSMEPGIMDGDTVLVDRSQTRLGAHNVLAVGVEDAIYLKRVEQRGDSLVLHSDNKTHADIALYGDELHSFRVIGKVVWLCRDCR